MPGGTNLASRNSHRCESPTAGGSAVAGRATSAPLCPQQKHKVMGKEGDRGAGAAPSVCSLAGEEEEAQGAVKGKR